MHPPGPSSKEFRIADVQVFRKLTDTNNSKTDEEVPDA
jgi:hypothetical protein